MKFSSAVIKGLALSVAIFVSLASTPSAHAQSEAGAVAARDYSFTISTAQPWTDTGVDLQAGDSLDISAKARAGDGCDPEGTKAAPPAAGATPSLLVATAPAGALIAKLQEQGQGVLVGSSRQLKADQPGHLFFGTNNAGPNGAATPACSFSVKVHVANTGSAPQATVPGKALTPATSSATATTATPGTQPTGQAASAPAKTDTPQDIKSKLAAAAQVFLAGQFGTGAPASSSSAPASDAVSPTSATATAATPATPALTISTAALDSGLKKNIDGLPRRVNDQFDNQGDMVNFVLVGSQEQVQSALQAANWHLADIDNKEAVLKAVLETYQKKDYLAMPMSQLYLFGRKQDFGYELAAAYSVVASRHHFRIWKAPTTWNGQTMWAGAGTHDIGFEKDQRNGSVTHKIDPAVDGERDNIGQTLQQSGKVKSLSYYLPPDPVQGAKNATGGGYRSDGRILVIVLQ
jgi:LssY C-terminus